MPHEWLGISTEYLVGLLILLVVPAVFFAMLLVMLDRQKQLKRHLADISWRLGGPIPERRPRRREREVVVQGPWRDRGSG